MATGAAAAWVGWNTGGAAYAAVGGQGASAMIAGGIAGGAAGGATGGGLSALASGGNIGAGMLQGAGYGGIVGGITSGLASFGFPNFQPFGSGAMGSIGNRLFNSGLTGGAFGAAYAGVTGGDIGQGAAMGALDWAAGEGINMSIGHSLGFALSDSHEFREGAFYYYSEGRTPFTIGGAIIGDKATIYGYNIVNGQWDYSHTVDQHERSHFPQQTALSVGYIPAHLISQGISAIASGFDFQYGTHRYNIFERWLIDVPSY